MSELEAMDVPCVVCNSIQRVYFHNDEHSVRHKIDKLHHNDDLSFVTMFISFEL